MDSNTTDGFIEEGETVFDVLKALLACILSSLLKYSKLYSVQTVYSFRKIPKISPGAYIFQRPFLPFLLCFTLYLRAISKYKAPEGGLIFGGAI